MEIKTGEFVFLRKQRDNPTFVYLSSLAFSGVSIGTLIREPTRNLHQGELKVGVIIVSPAASRGYYITGLMRRNVSPAIGFLQMDSVEACSFHFLGEGF